MAPRPGRRRKTCVHDGPVPTDPDVYTVDEFCELFNISRGAFYGMRKRGEVRTISIGARTLVPGTERQRILAGEPLIADGLTTAERRAARAQHNAEAAKRAAAKSARAREAGRSGGGRPRTTTKPTTPPAVGAPLTEYHTT